MARRRRQSNPLLPRIFAVAVLVNFVLVLIAAQFGALKAIQRQFGTAKVVLVSPTEAPKEKEKPVEKKNPNKSQPVRKAPGSQSKSSATPHVRTTLPQVVTSGPASDGGGSGPVTEQGNQAGGAVPTPIASGDKPKVDPPQVTHPEPKLDPKPEPKPVDKTQPEPKPTPKPDLKFIDCDPISQPEPVIPDDLRSEELSKDFIAEFTVGADGSPLSVKKVQSTGIDELDKIALDTAKKWRFKPATLGGVPTEQTVRLVIQFQVQ